MSLTSIVERMSEHDHPWYEDIVMPALLRAARTAYRDAVAASLAAAGYDDLPRNGAYVIGGIARGGSALGDLVQQLGVSKQAAGQLIDTLVMRGYLDRRPDTDDRRKLTIELTERGRAAAAAVRHGVEAVDRELAARLSPGHQSAMRSGLAVLANLSEVPAGGPRFLDVAPIFKVADLTAALEHYRTLGFAVRAYDDGDGYGFASRNGVNLHLTINDSQPDAEGALYLEVDDADAVYAMWSQPDVKGVTVVPADMDWGMHEGSHTDPDGNVIRFGSAMRHPVEPHDHPHESHDHPPRHQRRTDHPHG